ncbi:MULTISPECIES: hypothetical protein [Bacillaceae]|uniref:Core-binding (CB) domain-containing protein n=1 Tax=Evansella alkalicola TaxID=745819 RepID=A0ABS6JYZ4_9BACI|nr:MULTISPECIES: hypothetical protein [Bacillaceae]MBU9723816.1 hypothetical protein [Bacillus alkalicola]
MSEKDDFIKWLENNTDLSDSSIGKYSGAINTISRELKNNSIIEGTLYNGYNLVEVVELKDIYFSVNQFIEKDKRGNRMYSRAFTYYIEFLKYERDRNNSNKK